MYSLYKLDNYFINFAIYVLCILRNTGLVGCDVF